MASSGTIGPLLIWATGKWTSQLLDLSLQHFPNSGQNKWGWLRWKETNTSSEASAYVRIDLLDSDENVLQSDIGGSEVINNSRFNRSINIASYNNANTIDIKIRFKLYSLDKQPTVENIELNSNERW